MSEDLRERLAAVEHERWAHWQGWMHSACQSNGDGSLTIPAELVERWERQIRTPYADLSEAEKKSDREQVDRYLPLVEAEIAALTAERDGLRAEVHRLRQRLDEATRAEDDDLWLIASDEWARQRIALTADRDALAARLERAEKVVEAAVAWLAQAERLADALDSYQKATDAQ